MDDSKLLITGSNGQLGRALQARYPNARAITIQELNIATKMAVLDFDWANITTVINAAAYTNVDGAETAEGRVAAWQANAVGVSNLSQACQDNNLTLVHISSDYVFDGTKSPHTEVEFFSPINNYGASKAAGDIAAALTQKHFILRTSWVIGQGKNFVRTMLDIGKKGIDPKVVCDQIGRPTFTSELVRAIDHLLSSDAEHGTYNITNGGEETSWADITEILFNQASLPRAVTKITTADYFAGKDGVAKRPLGSTFDLDKIHSSGFASRDWRDDLRDYVASELAASANASQPASESPHASEPLAATETLPTRESPQATQPEKNA